MKIIIAVHHFPPLRTAGAELEAFRTAKTLIARGHSVQVICVEAIDVACNDRITWSDDLYKGVPVRRLSFNLAAAPNPERWEYDNVWIGDHLTKYLQERTPDLFHLFSGYLLTGRTLLVAKQLGIPTLVTLTDFWFLCRRFTLLRSDGSLSTLPIDAAVCARCIAEERRLPRLLGKVAPGLMSTYWRMREDKVHAVEERIDFCLHALNSADIIINRSHFLGQVYAEAGTAQEKMVFCRQGFEGLPTYLHKPNNAEAPRPPLRVIYLGQISHHKGVHTLLEALQQIDQANIEVSIYGDIERFPNYVAKLRQIAGQDARIHLKGLVQPDQISALLQKSDVLVVPSIWYENSPNTIAEAFAHGVPVIASNLGGMAELVQHEQNGLVFGAGDAKDLAQQLQRLVDETDLLSRLQNGIEPVKSIAEEIDELEAFYATLMKSHSIPELVPAIYA